MNHFNPHTLALSGHALFDDSALEVKDTPKRPKRVKKERQIVETVSVPKITSPEAKPKKSNSNLKSLLVGLASFVVIFLFVTTFFWMVIQNKTPEATDAASALSLDSPKAPHEAKEALSVSGLVVDSSSKPRSATPPISEQDINQRIADLNEREKALLSNEHAIMKRDTALTERESKLNIQESSLKAKNEALNQREAMIQKKEKQLDWILGDQTTKSK